MVLGEPALCQCLGDSSVWQHKGIIAFLKTWTSIIFHWKKFPKLWNKLLFFLFYKDQNSRFLSVIRAFHSFDQGDVMAQWVLQHPSTYYTLWSLGDKASWCGRCPGPVREMQPCFTVRRNRPPPTALQGLTSRSLCSQSRAQGPAAPRHLEFRGHSERCAAAHSG